MTASRKWVWFSPAGIKTTFWRRAILLVAFPTFFLIKVGVMPLIYALLAAWDAAVERLQEEFSSSGWVLLRRGFLWMWDARFHTDSDAALADAVKRVPQ